MTRRKATPPPEPTPTPHDGVVATLSEVIEAVRLMTPPIPVVTITREEGMQILDEVRDLEGAVSSYALSLTPWDNVVYYTTSLAFHLRARLTHLVGYTAPSVAPPDPIPDEGIDPLGD